MNEEKHLFHVDGVWVGGGDGDGELTMDWNASLAYGRPAQTGGKPGRANPEDLLVSAVVSCYSITLALMAENRHLDIARIAVTAEGELVRQPDKRLKFTAIRLFPQLTLAEDNEANRQKALELAHRAEERCLISNALRGNVEVTVTPMIVALETAAVA